MVAAYARLGQTASIALELGKCGRLNTLLGALVNNPVRVPTCRWQKTSRLRTSRRPHGSDLMPAYRDE